MNIIVGQSYNLLFISFPLQLIKSDTILGYLKEIARIMKSFNPENPNSDICNKEIICTFVGRNSFLIRFKRGINFPY
jgi:hypothetical protein